MSTSGWNCWCLEANKGSRVNLLDAPCLFLVQPLHPQSYTEPKSGNAPLCIQGSKFSCSCLATHDTRFVPQWESLVFSHSSLLAAVQLNTHNFSMFSHPAPHVSSSSDGTYGQENEQMLLLIECESPNRIQIPSTIRLTLPLLPSSFQCAAQGVQNLY